VAWRGFSRLSHRFAGEPGGSQGADRPTRSASSSGKPTAKGRRAVTLAQQLARRPFARVAVPHKTIASHVYIKETCDDRKLSPGAACCRTPDRTSLLVPFVCAHQVWVEKKRKRSLGGEVDPHPFLEVRLGLSVLLLDDVADENVVARVEVDR
jgi:hypothetical protein